MKIAAFYENILTAAQREGISLENALVQLKAEGLEMIYISGDSLKEKEAELLELFDRLGLPIEGLHQHFDFSHHPEDDSYKEYIDLAVRCGAGNFLVVPGFVFEGEEDNQKALIQNMIASMRKVVAYGTKMGIPVCMEDFDHMFSPSNSIAGLDRFIQALPDLKCAFDTGNFCCYKEDPLSALPAFRGKLCTMHLKDRATVPSSELDRGCVCFDGSIAWPTPVGNGCIPIAEILTELRKTGYTGNAVIELYGYEDMLNGLKQSLRWLRQM